jgi:acetylornithine deacetylase/succinyl-diaminopimelate desuccinylase-like protein
MSNNLVDTLLDLMKIGSDNRTDKGPIIEYMAGRLEKLGLEASITGPKEAPALWASFGEGGIILSGHLDTVPVGDGWSRGQGEIQGDIIYGRGASDMKGAVAANLDAAETLVENGVPFSIFLTTDEEEGMFGALELSGLDVLEKARGILIGEPTGMMIVAREKGVYRFRITTRGIAGHSSQPWLGENAIMKMHGLVSRLDDMLTPPLDFTEERTASVTTMNGGAKNNVIPESCSAEIDVRFPPGESIEFIRSLIEDRLVDQDYGIETIAELDPFEAPESSNLISEAIDFLNTEMYSAAFATEASRFSLRNPDIIICGPGKPGTCHIVDEWVSKIDLKRYRDFVLHMARFSSQG